MNQTATVKRPLLVMVLPEVTAKEKYLEALGTIWYRRNNWWPATDIEYEDCCRSDRVHSSRRLAHLRTARHIANKYEVDFEDLKLLVYLSKYLRDQNDLWHGAQVVMARNKIMGERLSRRASLTLARKALREKADGTRDQH